MSISRDTAEGYIPYEPRSWVVEEPCSRCLPACPSAENCRQLNPRHHYAANERTKHYLRLMHIMRPFINNFLTFFRRWKLCQASVSMPGHACMDPTRLDSDDNACTETRRLDHCWYRTQHATDIVRPNILYWHPENEPKLYSPMQREGTANMNLHLTYMITDSAVCCWKLNYEYHILAKIVGLPYK